MIKKLTSQDQFAMTLDKLIEDDLYRYLTTHNHADERRPECPDVEAEWEKIGAAYLADGVREFHAYPAVSLGWMMFLGMAVARLWDMDWEHYLSMKTPYEEIRNKRGYDEMDEYILDSILMEQGEQRAATNKLVAACAERVYSHYLHQRYEPATPEAFKGYVTCLKHLYHAGMAVQLKKMGYRMVNVQ